MVFWAITSSLDETSSWYQPKGGLFLACIAIILEATVVGLVILTPWPKQLWIRGIICSAVLLYWGNLTSYTVVVLIQTIHILIHVLGVIPLCLSA